MTSFIEGSKVKKGRFIAMIVGESGTGKTTQCIHLPAEKTALITMEEGLLCFDKHNYMPRLVSVVKTSDELASAFKEINAGLKGIEYIFIDSLTEIADMVLLELKADPKFSDPKMILKLYGTYSEIMTKIVKSFRDLSQYSIIFTCISEKAKDGVEVYDDFCIPGSAVKNNLKSWLDIVLHIKAFKNEEGASERVFLTSTAESRLAKDRSGVLEEVENANIAYIINKIRGVSNGEN
jgi:hypothetical protein